MASGLPSNFSCGCCCAEHVTDHKLSSAQQNQNTLGDYPFTIEQRGDTQLKLNLPAPSSPIHSTVTQHVTTTENHWQCHICPESFPRWQDRDRHQLTHIPYFVHCPLPHCAWRGYRAGLSMKHWQREDHRGYHERYGHTPERSQIETYGPWEILNQMTNGTVSPSEGAVKAYEPQKKDVWMDPWGRSRKKTLSWM
ncbi:hypothetical protein EDB89DRAFT_2247309 [Lactarius sanguifluus]|nr:hypothetical protein EDB89DRAFT_2247309 [Lactarius sanguifluus]